ncbi:MAG: S1C family serine protease [bacterium]
MTRAPVRRLAPAAFGLVLLAAGEALAVADSGLPGTMDASRIQQVTSGWRERVLLVVADGGQGRVDIDQVIENPKALYRKRRVGCAVRVEDRYLLTTASVAADASEVEIFDEHGRHVLAQVVGRDRFLDLALLRAVEPLEELTEEPLDWDREPIAGEACLVLGNAYGSSLSATLGTMGGILDVLAFGMPIRVHRVLAPIYPGDSGAPVLDEEGRFVGIVTGVSRPRVSPVLEAEGDRFGLHDPPDSPAGAIGFAVPAEECRRAWMDLRDFGVVRRAYLGVHLPPDEVEETGARILGVHPDGPAARAGIRAGDLITTYGRHYVTGGRQFCALVANSVPGETIDVRLVRGQHEQVLEVKLGLASRQPGLRLLPPPQRLPADSTLQTPALGDASR